MTLRDPRDLNRSSGSLNSINITCEVLYAIQTIEEPTLAKITQEIDRSKSTVYDHLHSLMANNLVVRYDADNPTIRDWACQTPVYHLSSRFVSMSDEFRSHHESGPVVEAELEAVAEAVGETALYAIPEYGQVVHLHQSRPAGGVDLGIGPGSRERFHSTALGKATLSAYAEEDVVGIFDRYGLPAVTGETVTDLEELLSELRSAADRGYAVEEEENVRGVRGVAAPVVTGERVLGAVGVVAPVTRLDDDRLDEAAAAVQRAANVIQISCSVE